MPRIEDCAWRSGSVERWRLSDVHNILFTLLGRFFSAVAPINSCRLVTLDLAQKGFWFYFLAFHVCLSGE